MKELINQTCQTSADFVCMYIFGQKNELIKINPSDMFDENFYVFFVLNWTPALRNKHLINDLRVSFRFSYHIKMADFHGAFQLHFVKRDILKQKTQNLQKIRSSGKFDN